MKQQIKEKYFKDFLSRLENPEMKVSWENSIHFKEKFFDSIYPDIININNPKILEFGVHKGFSTSIFLDVCNLNNGTLYSVDINDYSEFSKDKNWNFIKSKDDDFDLIEKKIPEEFNVILIDTVHKPKHVEKLIYHYYPKLKKNGILIIDDISWLYYTSRAERDNFFTEINNSEGKGKILFSKSHWWEKSTRTSKGISYPEFTQPRRDDTLM